MSHNVHLFRIFLFLYKVDINGVVSVHTLLTESYNPRQLPTKESFIAPFWADVDTRNDAGVVKFWETVDIDALAEARAQILSAFPELDFHPDLLFVATWDEVGYYNMKRTKVS